MNGSSEYLPEVLDIELSKDEILGLPHLLMYNELIFEEFDTGFQVSLASRYNDEEMARVFAGIVETYGDV